MNLAQTVERAVGNERARNVLGMQLLRAGGVTIGFAVSLYLGLVEQRADWGVMLPPFSLYWFASLTMALVAWRAPRQARLVGWAALLLDIGAVGFIQHLAVPVSASPGGVAAFTLAVFCAFITAAVGVLDRVLLGVAAAVCAAIVVALQREAGIAVGPQVLAAVVLAGAAGAGAYVVSRVDKLLYIVSVEALTLERLATGSARPSQTPAGGAREVSALAVCLQHVDELARTLDARRLVTLLTLFQSTMLEVVRRHGGVLYQVVDEAMFAHFGALERDPRHAQRAVACALEMVSALRSLGLDGDDPIGRSLRLRVGLHSAELATGDLTGDPSQLDLGPLGDLTRVASRLMVLDGEPGTVVLTDATRASASDIVDYEPIESIATMGGSLACFVAVARTVSGKGA